MANRIILPKDKVEVDEVIFLAGPVFAGGGWQNEAIENIRSQNSRVYIAVPDYSGVVDEVYRNSAEKSEEKFQRQLRWEQHYLGIAEKNGAILFWLPAQKETSPSGRIYARDTRPEIGGYGWGLLRNNIKAHVAVGGEEGFDGLDVQRRNFEFYAPHIKFNKTLVETCDCALEFLKN